MTTQPSRMAAVGQEAEHLPTYTLERQIARARRQMGEREWRRLNALFTASPDEASSTSVPVGGGTEREGGV